MKKDEGVGHAGDVVGYDAREAFGPRLFEVADGQLFRLVDPVIEERGDDLFGFVVLDFERLAGVERVVEIALLLQALRFDLRRENCKPRGMAANVVEAVGTDGSSPRAVVSMRSSVSVFCMSCSASLKRYFSSTPACSFSTVR